MSTLNRKERKKPWPTRDAMTQIYKQKLWGGEQTDFYSGSGSHDPWLTDPYVDILRDFLSSFDIPPVVCDLGCGDVNIGSRLFDLCERYIGVDIVDSLIERNKLQFSFPNVEFQCLDIATDELPSGDCVILRHVLQHLSNDEIRRILKKLNRFSFLIVTEHLPEGDFPPNKDIISGQGIRLKSGSGVVLLSPPFELSFSEKEQWLSLQTPEWTGRIVTTLYRL